MSNAGQAVLTIGGTIVGAYFGNPALGYAIGSSLGAAAFPTQNKVEGPRIDDPKIPGTEPGRPIPWIQGRVRLTPDFLWKSDVRTISTTTESGGKGTEPETEQKTYSYEVDLFFLLTDNLGLPNGETAGVTRSWYNKKLIWTNLSTEGQAALVGADAEDAGFIARAFANLQAAASTELWERMTVYTGGADQLPDPTYEAAVGTANAPAYRNRTSVFIKSFQLGGSPNLGLFEFEVCTKATGGTVDATVLLQVDPENTGFTDISSYGLTPTNAGSYNIVNNMIEVTDDAGHLTYPGTSIVGKSTKSYTFEYFVISPAPVPGAGAAVISQTENDGAGPRIARVNNTGDVDAGHLRFGNFGTVIFNTTMVTPVTPTKYHVCLMYQGSEDGTPQAWLFIDGVLGGTDISATACLPQSAGDGFQFGPSGPFAGNFYIGPIRMKLGLVYSTAGFTPPEGFDAPDADADTLTPVDEDYDDVVSRICQRGDALTTSQFDVTDLAGITRQVRSLWMTQVAPSRPTLEMLGGVFFNDATLSDKLYFRRRAQAVVATIPYADLGAAPEGDEPPQPLAFLMGSELELPAQKALSFADVENDYQTDVQYSDRLLTAMESMQTISVPMGMTKSEGKQVIDAQAFDALAALETTTLYLDGRYAKLEPMDAVNVLDEDGVAHRELLKDRTDNGQVLIFKARRDDPAVFDPDGVTDSAIGSEIDITAPVDTEMALLDMPLMRDADDGPHIVVAAKGADSPWPGAAVLRSNDDVEYQRVASVTESAVFGTCGTTLGDWTGPHVFDEMSSVTVSVGDGTLSSSTRSALMADSTVNAMLIGSEAIQFRVATLVSTGVYKLTGLLRGLRGTEWAMVDHAAAEECVLLTTTGLRRIDMQTNQLGVEKFYKGVTFGRALSTADAESFTANGVSLKPFSPTTLRALEESNGDVTITWRRRSRLATRGISTLGQSIPLGEETESYEVDIVGGSPPAVVRTLTATSETATYTAAQQSTDGLSPGGITYRVRQISAVIGDGYELEQAA